MTSPDHLSQALLVRALDRELTASEDASVESHLKACALCREDFQHLSQLTLGIASAVNTVPVTPTPSARDFPALLASRQIRNTQHHPANVMRRFGWGMAIAATLALGVMLAPHRLGVTQAGVAATLQSQSVTLDVNGENFIFLPYSDPALPVNTARVVQMQVPAASLASAGIVLEPVGTAFSSPDRTVLADVLLGIDGQPLGVHVLSVE